MKAFYLLSYAFCMAVFFGAIFLCVSVARDTTPEQFGKNREAVVTYWNQP